MDVFRQWLTSLGVYTAHPAAFFVVIGYGLLWAIIQPEKFDWHGVATLATWIMTLFIQRAGHRDTQAIHAKLDELIRTSEKARSDLVELDDLEPEEIEQHRQNESHR